jgi:outer membrane lipoprotein-sorting protein
MLAALLLFLQAPAQTREVDQATAVLRNVASVYRTARSCYFEGKVTAEVKSEAIEAKIQSSFVWATVGPTKIRMQVKSPMMEMLVVSDGPTFWEYMPHLKQYTRKQSEPTTVTSRGIDNVDRTSDKAEHARMWALAVGVAIPKFDDIAESLKEARFLQGETLEIDGASMACDVIEAVYDSGSGEGKGGPVRKTFWVDKSRYVVVREALTTGFSKVGADRLGSPRIVTTFSVVKINEPLADDLFVFTPPGDSREIKDFNDPDSARKKR